MSDESKPKQFTHLHCHSEYSLLDGIAKRSDMVQKAKDLGMRGLAMTEHGNIFNAVSFYRECVDNSLVPIIGCEFYVAPDSRLNRSYARKGEAEEDAKNGDLSLYAYHLTVLSKNRQGFENLKALSTKSYREGFYRKPRIDDELLAQHKEGLIVLSGCLAGKIARLIIAGNKPRAIEEIDRLRGVFKDNFYLELMAHDIEEENIVREALIDIGKTHGIPCVMTGDSHLTNHGDELAHEVALCLGGDKTMSSPDRWKFSGGGYWFKSPNEMWDIADTWGIPAEAVEHTNAICNSVDDYGFKLASKTKKFSVPLYKEEERTFTDEECHDTLAIRAQAGLTRRGFGDNLAYQMRLAEELDMMKRKNFSSYFLIIADIVDFMRREDIVLPLGRGSSCGSLVCYALYITGVDPIARDITFARFINEGRKDLPDIDTDISQEHRHRILEYISNKYGADRVAHIVTFQSMRPKAAIDNVGRVLDVPASVRRQATAEIHDDPTSADTLNDYLEVTPTAKMLVEQIPMWKDVAIKLEGNNRNLGVHAAGIVIANEPIDDSCPLIRDAEDGLRVTQYDMADIAELGLLKLDMLGLKTLDVIGGTLKMIKERHGRDIDWHTIPKDDAATYKMLTTGKFVSVFQYDSSGMRALAKQMLPDQFDHLVAMNALYRPGGMKKPADGGPSILEMYVERRHGRAPIETWHPELDEVFAPTLGLCIYQESVMSLAKIMAGFTDVEADEYRAAVGKKDRVKFQAAQNKFIEHGVKLGRPKEFMEGLADKLSGFARYGWNKSHSEAYGFISYVTAWLETNYPLEYYTTLLNVNRDEKAEKVKVLIAGILQKGVALKTPDINHSGQVYTASATDIHMGLRSVRLLGEKAYNIIEAERANGPYLDFIDFCIRVGRDGHVNKSIKENLVKAGAFRFDTTMTAKDMVDNVELIQTLVKKYVDKLTKEEIREELMEKIVFTGNEYASQEILNNERSVLSFFISSHPALQYSRLFSLFDGMDFISPAELQEQDDGTTVTMFGIVEQKMLKMTNGDTPKPYLTVKVSDQLASETVRIWSPLSTILNDRIIQDQLILMTGKVKPDAFIAGAKQLQVNGACAIILQGGIPVNSIMADEEYKCNQVVQLIGADVAMTNNQMLNGACAMTFKSNAYIKPDHFETLKKLKNVRYGIAFEMQVFEPRKRNKYAK